MIRREFITLLGGAAAWPVAARAQQQALPVVAILSSASQSALRDVLVAFRQGLKETGHVEGQNIVIESYWAEGKFERLSQLAADLVQRRIAVIVTTGVSSSLAAKAVNANIPQVFVSQDDPVKLGLVASFNRPGGNATGMSLLTHPLVAKRLEFLRQLVRPDAPIAFLMNPGSPEAEFHLSHMQAAAQEVGQEFALLKASSEREIDSAFAMLAQKQGSALIVSTDPFFVSRLHQIVVLAAYLKIPAIFDRREFAVAGGLISYGAHLADAYGQIGIYVGKILKGTDPATLPVMQPTKFELVINLKTAQNLRLKIPDKLLALADEVIE
jgi:putative tryptophan/tyrosine transport system substrate-binding protein